MQGLFLVIAPNYRLPILCLLSVLTGIAMIVYCLRGNELFFYTPAQVFSLKPVQEIRIGGIVRDTTRRGQHRGFVITDNMNQFPISVRYDGAIPLMFRIGQGVVVKGKFRDDVFCATELLIKHDEHYVPEKSD